MAVTQYSLESLLQNLAEREGSDLYLAVDAYPTVAVHGELQAIGSDMLTPDQMVNLAQQSMSAAQWDELQKKLEVNLAYSTGGFRYRLNVYHQRSTMAMVARLIKPNIFTVTQLGLPPILDEIMLAERGIILVTGATGSGKSTTLAAMIDHRNTQTTGHIVTIEDPVEFVHEHKRCIISQREVGIDTLSFHEALKSALRQAPKVILIGEIRDAETARFAIHASDTGHLVLATLHTNSANQTIERLLNMFPIEMERQILMQLAMNLRGIISQRLVPKKDGGRIAAVEILLNTSRVEDLIMQGNVQELKTVMAKGNREGMQTFDQALHRLVQQNLIEEEVALKFADSANDLKLKIRGFGGSGFAS